MNARLFGLVPFCTHAPAGDRPEAAVVQELMTSMLRRFASSLTFEHLFVAADEPGWAVAAALAASAGRAEALRCAGGTRVALVRSALELLKVRVRDDDWVLVHDPCWPCTPASALRRLMSEVRDDAVGGLLAVPVADTLKRSHGGGDLAARAVLTEERRSLWHLQMPQVFRFAVLQRALCSASFEADADEAAAVEALAASGAIASPRLVTGSALNIRICDAADAALAIAVLRAQDDVDRQFAAA